MWIKDITKKVNEEVEIKGWVNARRDHGKIIFIDLRDRSGIVQVVFSLDDFPDVYNVAENVRPEWIIEITGIVKERPKKLVNLNIITGKVEIEAKTLNILSKAKTPPIPIEGSNGYNINEELRMKYRYLDLRRKRLRNNMILRSKIIKSIRDFLSDKDFIEVETPILTKSTPEGARDYLVPSRLYHGKFYALPQSPQQYKQLLMVAGVQRYFQITKCFRDEDTRGDRQPEFTQLDLEMSFVDEKDVMNLNEELLIYLVETFLLDKKITQVPFPRMSYAKAIKKYGTDRPDLRKDKNNSNELAFVWITDFPFFEKDKGGKWTFTHNPFSSPKTEIRKKWLKMASDKKMPTDEEIEKIISSQYDIVLNGYEIGGGSIRENTSDGLVQTLKIIGYDDDEIISKFGHMIEAFKYGTPPHGGIAWGLDRLIMVFTGEPNIREVIAFPKTGDARDPMMGSPDEVSREQLEELGIEVKKEEDK